MFLDPGFTSAKSVDFPRVSGDVPTLGYKTNTLALFSPRERGCSDQWDHVLEKFGIFPA